MTHPQRLGASQSNNSIGSPNGRRSGAGLGALGDVASPGSPGLSLSLTLSPSHVDLGDAGASPRSLDTETAAELEVGVSL